MLFENITSLACLLFASQFGGLAHGLRPGIFRICLCHAGEFILRLIRVPIVAIVVNQFVGFQWTLFSKQGAALIRIFTASIRMSTRRTILFDMTLIGT